MIGAFRAGEQRRRRRRFESSPGEEQDPSRNSSPPPGRSRIPAATRVLSRGGARFSAGIRVLSRGGAGTRPEPESSPGGGRRSRPGPRVLPHPRERPLTTTRKAGIPLRTGPNLAFSRQIWKNLDKKCNILEAGGVFISRGSRKRALNGGSRRHPQGSTTAALQRPARQSLATRGLTDLGPESRRPLPRARSQARSRARRVRLSQTRGAVTLCLRAFGRLPPIAWRSCAYPLGTTP